MSGDDEIIIDPETIDASDNLSEDGREDRPKSRLKLGVLGIVAGAMLAVGAGGIGGFAAHEYFKSPVVEPDLSAFEAKVSDIEETLATQTRKAERLDTQVKKVAKDLGQELTQLEATWSRELSDLEAMITAAPLAVGSGTQPEDAISEDAASENAVEGEKQPFTTESVALDIRPQLLAAVSDIRREFEQDVTEINRRLERLETAQLDFEATQNNVPVRFPIERFTAQLEGDAQAVKTDSRIGKFLKKHVSVNRTGHAEAFALLDRIDAAVASGDWDAAATLSGDLPLETRSSVEEWIAATRP